MLLCHLYPASSELAKDGEEWGRLAPEAWSTMLSFGTGFHDVESADTCCMQVRSRCRCMQVRSRCRCMQVRSRCRCMQVSVRAVWHSGPVSPVRCVVARGGVIIDKMPIEWSMWQAWRLVKIVVVWWFWFWLCSFGLWWDVCLVIEWFIFWKN